MQIVCPGEIVAAVAVEVREAVGWGCAIHRCVVVGVYVRAVGLVAENVGWWYESVCEALLDGEAVSVDAPGLLTGDPGLYLVVRGVGWGRGLVVVCDGPVVGGG